MAHLDSSSSSTQPNNGYTNLGDSELTHSINSGSTFINFINNSSEISLSASLDQTAVQAMV
ncbi:21940_t:CDS:2 [Dentiscutata erythropus]|uniref:21940_t:CDS:1 n=1 Tax=Dentiscutata erythropus TaxID=1348616 RepID=A0A9N9EZB3_9GLOM|nr:21940_t:CDS:2 [Dentiscutata erythropus]